ncbi:DUF6069 family protein [Amycolatopsis sp. NEAU-NG30]|uniref:DUF6069 family protein n=1 Tax=Amycolatopsis melonis TaxID=3156488 RepID=A0ABV0L812_9PSEU
MATAFLVPAVAGSIGCAIVVAVTRAMATVPVDFKPFHPAAYVPLTVVAAAAGLAGWLAVRRRATRPATTLRSLASAVVALSFVPDVLLGITGFLPGTTWPGVAGLMVMHLVIAAVAVASYARFFPAPAARTQP